MSSALGWIVIMSKSSAEHVAERTLQSAGWRVYCPRYRKLLRGTKIINGKKVGIRRGGEVVFRPLFSRYIFCELHPEQQWWPIRKAVGVDRIVMEPSTVTRPGEPDRIALPALLHPEIIELIRQAMDAGEFDEYRPRIVRNDLRQRLNRGERPMVRANGSGIVGRLVGLNDAGRAQVLISLLGREVQATADAGPLELMP